MKVIDINWCGTLLPDSTPDLYCRLFPDWFPIVQGHPNEQKPVKVSMEQCVSHYLRLTSRSFATHSFLTLTAFYMRSRKRAQKTASISCSYHPDGRLAIHPYPSMIFLKT